jgi:hypothetical protein
LNDIKSIAVPITRRGTSKKSRAAAPALPASVAGAGDIPKKPRPSPLAVVHNYHVGQRVSMVGSGRYWGRVSGLCRIVALMPHEAGPFLYRVRSETESFERIVAEADLAPEEEVDLP